MPRFSSQLYGWSSQKFPNGPFELNTNSPQARGLVGWWPTLGGRHQPRTVHDYSGYNHDAVMPAGNEPVWTSSTIGRALTYNDTSWLNVADSNLLDGWTRYVLGGWIYPTTHAQNGGIIHKGNLGSNAGLYIFQTISGSPGVNVGIRWRIGGSSLTSTGRCLLNQWSHVLAVSDGATDYLYINGVQDASTRVAVSVGTDSNLVRLGQYWATTSNGFQGDLSDLRIYNVYKSPYEIRQMYDPATRWDLYKPIIPRRNFAAPAAAAITGPLIGGKLVKSGPLIKGRLV